MDVGFPVNSPLKPQTQRVTLNEALVDLVLPDHQLTNKIPLFRSNPKSIRFYVTMLSVEEAGNLYMKQVMNLSCW